MIFPRAAIVLVFLPRIRNSLPCCPCQPKIPLKRNRVYYSQDRAGEISSLYLNDDEKATGSQQSPGHDFLLVWLLI